MSQLTGCHCQYILKDHIMTIIDFLNSPVGMAIGAIIGAWLGVWLVTR